MARIAVAAPSADATEAAVAVAQAGGNAVDACVAALVVASVTEVGIVSPMGGAYVNVRRPGEDPVVLDGYVEMPGRGRDPERFGGGWRSYDLDYYGGIRVHGGHGSVATPGMFAALAAASTRFGAIPWAELVAPAAHVADRGWVVGQAAAYYLGYAAQNLFAWDPQSSAFMQQNGTPAPQQGDRVRSGDLANALGVIARDGAATLYTGEIAHVIAEDMDARGGLLGLPDLEAYRVVPRTPLQVTLADWDIATNAPPSIGGPVLAALLAILGERTHGTDRLDPLDILTIQRDVLDYRRRMIDTAEDLDLAGHELGRIIAAHGLEGLTAPASSPDTIHVSVVDEDGLACSITTSAGYGSGVTVPDTGLMLNNALGEPELNCRGLHALPPGTRLASNMAPTTAVRQDGTVLAVGSPGASRITTALMQVIAYGCIEDRPLAEAVAAPRMHVEFTEDGRPLVQYEQSPETHDAVTRSGMDSIAHEDIAMYFGGVGSALLRTDGSLDAAGDPRRAAATAIG